MNAAEAKKQLLQLLTIKNIPDNKTGIRVRIGGRLISFDEDPVILDMADCLSDYRERIFSAPDTMQALLDVIREIYGRCDVTFNFVSLPPGIYGLYSGQSTAKLLPVHRAVLHSFFGPAAPLLLDQGRFNWEKDTWQHVFEYIRQHAYDMAVCYGFKCPLLALVNEQAKTPVTASVAPAPAPVSAPPLEAFYSNTSGSAAEIRIDPTTFSTAEIRIDPTTFNSISEILEEDPH